MLLTEILCIPRKSNIQIICLTISMIMSSLSIKVSIITSLSLAPRHPSILTGWKILTSVAAIKWSSHKQQERDIGWKVSLSLLLLPLCAGQHHIVVFGQCPVTEVKIASGHIFVASVSLVSSDIKDMKIHLKKSLHLCHHRFSNEELVIKKRPLVDKWTCNCVVMYTSKG